MLVGRANIGPETNVLIMRAGPIGLVTMLWARASGLPRTVVVDVSDHCLSVTKCLGADDIGNDSGILNQKFLKSSIFSSVSVITVIFI